MRMNSLDPLAINAKKSYPRGGAPGQGLLPLVRRKVLSDELRNDGLAKLGKNGNPAEEPDSCALLYRQLRNILDKSLFIDWQLLQ